MLLRLLSLLVLALALFALPRLMPPTPLPDRLAVISEADTHIDNELYNEPAWVATWWKSSSFHVGFSLLQLVNGARVPYFDRVWQQQPDAKRGIYLDVGCGGGIATEALALLGYNMTGLDVSARSVAAAQAHAEAHGGLASTLRYVVGSAYTLPFPDSHFDGVVSSDVIEHIHDLPQFVREIHRVLKPGGRFVFDTIARTPLSYLVSIVGAQDLLGFVAPHTHDWRLFVNPDELCTLLTRSGFACDVVANDFVGMRPSLSPANAWQGLMPGLLGPFVETSSLLNNYLGYAIKT